MTFQKNCLRAHLPWEHNVFESSHKTLDLICSRLSELFTIKIPRITIACSILETADPDDRSALTNDTQSLIPALVVDFETTDTMYLWTISRSPYQVIIKKEKVSIRDLFGNDLECPSAERAALLIGRSLLLG